MGKCDIGVSVSLEGDWNGDRPLLAMRALPPGMDAGASGAGLGRRSVWPGARVGPMGGDYPSGPGLQVRIRILHITARGRSAPGAAPV